MKSISLLSLILSVVLTIILSLFVLKPTISCYEVQLITDSQRGVKFSAKNWVASPDSDGVVNFFVMGTVDTLGIKQCKLEISPGEEGKWYLQTGGYPAIDNMFIGKAQLGSKEYPMTKDQHYGFRITADNGRLLSQGTISAKAHQVYGTSSLLLILISVLASVLQVVFTVVCAIHERTRTA